MRLLHVTPLRSHFRHFQRVERIGRAPDGLTFDVPIRIESALLQAIDGDDTCQH